MFDRKELEGIIMLTEIAVRMERILHVLGINEGIDERIAVLQIRKKAQELIELSERGTNEKLDQVFDAAPKVG